MSMKDENIIDTDLIATKMQLYALTFKRILISGAAACVVRMTTITTSTNAAPIQEQHFQTLYQSRCP